MTALEIARKNYNRFADKKEITELINSIFSAERLFAKRNDNGDILEGEFESGVFDSVANTMRKEFVADKRCSIRVRELCVQIMREMEY